MTFTLPDTNASYAQWQAACDQINQVAFTVSEMEAGFAAIIHDADAGKAPTLPAFIRAFASDERVSDLVLAALRVRYEFWAEAWDNGIDLKASSTDVYTGLASRMITPDDFNIFPCFDDAEAMESAVR